MSLCRQCEHSRAHEAAQGLLPDGMDESTAWRALAWGLYPAWLLAGLGDWLAHRLQRIEYSAGLRETALHGAMLFELGLAILAVLSLEFTTTVFLLCLLCCLAHELTVWADLRYAESARGIPPPEQWVHSFQIVLPWAALGVVTLIHAEALSTWLAAAPDWRLEWRAPPLEAATWLLVIGSALLFVVLPFADELRRALRAERLSSGAATARRKGPVLPRNPRTR